MKRICSLVSCSSWYKTRQLHFRGPALGQLPMLGPGYDPRPIYVGLVVDKMALVQVFRFFLVQTTLVFLLSVLSRGKIFLSAPKGPDGLWGLRPPPPQFRVLHIRSKRDTSNSDTLIPRLRCELIVFDTLIVALSSVVELILNPRIHESIYKGNR
jgi:hypothetical protein